MTRQAPSRTTTTDGKPGTWVRRSVVTGVLGAALVASAVWWTRGPDREAARVAAEYRAGRPAPALAAVEQWIARRPGSADAWLWKARLGLALRRPADAAEALHKAETLGADASGVAVVRAIAAARSGRFAEAEPVLRRAFNASQAPDPLLDETLARGYLEAYDMPRARSVLTRWVRDAPGDPRPHLWRAEVDARTGDPAAEMSDYREALARDPASGPARLGLAETLRKAHRNAEAAEAFDAYLAAHPDDPSGRLGAGRNAAESGDADAALRHLRRAADLAPNDPAARRALADVLTREGDFPAALGHLDRALSVDPYDLEARHARGLVLTRLGRLEEAGAERSTAARLRAELDDLLAAQAVLVRSPKDLPARLRVTRWMFAHGKPSEGVRWAETVLRETPGQPDACLLLADHYAAAGQPGLANSYRAQAGPDAARAGPK